MTLDDFCPVTAREERAAKKAQGEKAKREASTKHSAADVAAKTKEGLYKVSMPLGTGCLK